MRIVWRRNAAYGLDQAYRYVARDNTPAARRLRLSIRAVVERLADFPASSRPGRVEGTRELIVTGTPYIVAYRVRGEFVVVVAVVHSARRWPDSLDC